MPTHTNDHRVGMNENILSTHSLTIAIYAADLMTVNLVCAEKFGFHWVISVDATSSRSPHAEKLQLPPSGEIIAQCSADGTFSGTTSMHEAGNCIDLE